MPLVKKLSITQFKNYDFRSFSFTERVVAVCGTNGRGKTNLLDALYYLCFTKSYFSRADAQNVEFGKEGFRLEGLVHDHRVLCIYRGTGKKEFYFDELEYDKFSDHIGRLPAVMVAPDDVELISGGSELRRRFADTLLSQVNATYLQQLILYNKVLQQRNSLLKRFAESGNTDWPLLEVVDDQLVQPGTYIFKERSALATELIPLVQQFYRQIAGVDEQVTFQYESQLHENDFYSLLNLCRTKDFMLQRSNGGIHKDDFSILLNGHSFKNTASQGQRKSLLFALKLAEFALLKRSKGFAPMLLLDDVFEKLDDGRMQQLLHWVCRENDGQVFITDTHQDRLEQAFQQLDTPFQLVVI